jgi:uncharacterized protein YggE
MGMSMATAQVFHCMTLLAILLVGQQGGSPFRMFEDDKPSFPSIIVTATGKISARPDVAQIAVGVVSQAPTAKDALEANNVAMDRLHALLMERGIAGKDIRTLQVEISPVYSQPPRPEPSPNGTSGAGTAVAATASANHAVEFVPRIVAYKVFNSMQIVCRQIERLGPILDAAVQGGANQISGISFRVEHPDRLLDDARKRAVQSAKRKAELLASEAGMTVGIPWKIEETSEPSTWSANVYLGAPLKIERSPTALIAAGEQELSVTISVVYELKNPK